MKKIIWITLIFISLTTSLLTTSCQEKFPMENEKLDSMELLLDQSKEYLNIDIELISARSLELGEQRNFIDQNYKDTFTMNFGRQLDMHRTVFKSYNRAIQEHKKWNAELEALSKQIETLRYSLNQGEMSSTEFRNFYNNERLDILALHAGSEQLKTGLYELEPLYQRSVEYFDLVIEDLRKD
ncbi:MAG: hypothetical protein JXR19_08655 [Bacteroidia bacterium]